MKREDETCSRNKVVESNGKACSNRGFWSGSNGWLKEVEGVHSVGSLDR